MGKHGSSYTNLVKTYNRSRRTPSKVVCECGKHIFESQTGRHLTTKMHSNLMRKKEEYKEFLVREKLWRQQRLKWLEMEMSKLEEERVSLQSKLEDLPPLENTLTEVTEGKNSAHARV